LCNLAGPLSTNCGRDPFEVVVEKSSFVDQQTLKLQEAPETVPAGEMPRSLMLIVERAGVQKVAPGSRVTVTGIHSTFNMGAGGRGRGGGGATAGIKQPYVKVLGVEMAADGSRRTLSTFSDAEVRAFHEFASRPSREVLQRIRDMVAPSIFGSPDIKMAIACLLFCGSRKRLADGVRLRGDVNVLLIGDPSTAKSQFLKFVEKTAPIAVYTSGKGSSAAGLTASVIKDPGSGEFYLEGGAMVLADGGVVCIDEFDKMRPEDRVRALLRLHAARRCAAALTPAPGGHPRGDGAADDQHCQGWHHHCTEQPHRSAGRRQPAQRALRRPEERAGEHRPADDDPLALRPHFHRA
jgi:DNA replication licensing factor MCM5